MILGLYFWIGLKAEFGELNRIVGGVANLRIW